MSCLNLMYINMYTVKTYMYYTRQWKIFQKFVACHIFSILNLLDLLPKEVEYQFLLWNFVAIIILLTFFIIVVVYTALH